MFGVAGLGIILFATTNIDDVRLLSAFFADRNLRTHAIVVGQFAGIGALTGANIAAALLALAIPAGWIALLGLAPLALGVAVALVTVANGGDNLGVYIPVFSREPSSIPVVVTVFALMTAVWCLAGHWFVNHPVLGARVRQYGHLALPFVLIGLGVHILSDARVLVSGRGSGF